MTAYAGLVLFGLDLGLTVEQIADELNIQPGSVGRALLREGRPELARAFWRAQGRIRPDRRRKRGVCACGTRISRKTQRRSPEPARCWPCHIQHLRDVREGRAR